MQEIFEKIIEKLEIESDNANDKIAEQNIVADMRYYDGVEDGVDKAVEIVRQEMEQYNNGWIPVSERLPEEKINPVTQNYYQYPVMFENDGVEDIKYYYFGNGHWRYGLQIMDDYVTHWMDIKPYQPKGETNE